MSKKVLLSVHNKSGLAAFAEGLSALDYQLIASGGTARLLRDRGLTVTAVSELTGMPEMLGGRVKTLHPAIHAGILAQSTPSDLAAIALQGFAPIDLVVCNLYPFQQTVARQDATLAEAVEQIDIGGVTLLRAAAKNFARVTVICDPGDYASVLAALQAGGPDEPTRRRLAAKAFVHTRDYDVAISAYLGEAAAEGTGQETEPLPAQLVLPLRQVQRMRYGENPHQAAALYAATDAAGPLGGALLQGKPLSYNNLLDLDAAWQACAGFTEPTVVIVKHLSPCGIASSADVGTAFPEALASDPVSAFGGVIAANRPVDADFTARLEDANLFVEAIAAPDFAPAALDWLATHKPSCRLLRMPPAALDRVLVRSVQGGFLLQETDAGDPPDAEWRVMTDRQPGETEWRSLQFAWQACRHVKSNAIVIARETATVGIGGGLPSRVDAVALAAGKAGARAAGAVLASDAFFPFPDGVEAAAQAGVTAVIQPGGSVRDETVIAAANRLNLAMVFTGVRHFRH